MAIAPFCPLTPRQERLVKLALERRYRIRDRRADIAQAIAHRFGAGR